MTELKKQEYNRYGDEWKKYIEATTIDFDSKILLLGTTIRKLETESEEKEVDLKILKKQIFEMREYLQQNMEQLGATFIKDGTIKISIQNNPPSIEINDLTIVPDLYLKAKMDVPLGKVPSNLFSYIKETLVDKSMLLKLYKDGGKLPEGVTFSQKKHLQITRVFQSGNA